MEKALSNKDRSRFYHRVAPNIIKGNTKVRLEQELAVLVKLISHGREEFFAKSGYDLESGSEWANHFEVKDIFHGNLLLEQTDLNIQMFYIKLHAYYEFIGRADLAKHLKLQRLAFAHNESDFVFSGRFPYNYFFT